MKRNSLLFLLTILSLVGFSTEALAEEWTNVSTAQEFYDAINGNHSAHVRLTAHIDLSSLSANGSYLFNFNFSGKITGESSTSEDRGYSLSNATHTLFPKLDGAEISSLVIMGCSFTGLDTSSGQICDEATNSTFSNLYFAGNTAEGSSSTYDCDQMGGVVGIATGCTFMNLFFLDCQMCTDGQCLGFVAGKATNSTFDGCVTNTLCKLWADGNGTAGVYTNAYTGGICGYSDGSTFTKCYNMGTVLADDDRVGGIIGYGTNKTTLTDCQNAGCVMHSTKEGYGRDVRNTVANNALRLAISTILIGSAQHYLRDYSQTYLDYRYEYVHNFRNHGSIYIAIASIVFESPFVVPFVCMASVGVWGTLKIYNEITDPDEFGGIAGTVEGESTLKRCANMGPVACSDEECGGIVGRLVNSTVESCYNRCLIKGGTYYCGGIVGYNNGGTVKYCLNVGSVSYKNYGKGNKNSNIGGDTGTCTYASNYMLASTASEAGEEHYFTQEDLPSGNIAKTLNDVLKKNGQDAIWRENLGTDFYPTIGDNTKSIVTSTTENYSLVQKIYTVGDFLMAVSNPLAQISLQNDIDLGGNMFMLSTEDHHFKGSIEGNGHTISNVTYEASTSDNNSRQDYTGEGQDIALFPYADNAQFSNFTIDNFHITQKASNFVKQEAFLVATSTYCKYSNITVTNSDNLNNNEHAGHASVAGLVAMSNFDNISDCSVSNSCRLEGYSDTKSIYDTYVGGVAAKASGTTFTHCYNAASIWANDDYEGGIVAGAYGCTLDRCLNAGTITGQTQVAGIAGGVEATTITKCVNIGTIKDDDSKKEENRAGIVGIMETSGSISDCINFGEIEYPAETNCGAIDGKHSTDVTYGDGNLYHCQYDGKAFSNINDEEYAKMTSGEYASGSDWLYQSIDNDPFVTKLPVPIPAAGKVYSNVLCDQSQSQNYSNYYHAEQGHSTTDYAGVCSLCGRTTGSELPKTVTISNASDLVVLSSSVKNGVDYSNTTFNLANDIDMSSVTDFMPIGYNAENAFKGTFNGNGHRIKNLSINRTNDVAGTGLFGCVSGKTTINDLVMDNTCMVSSTSLGVAGLVGCLISPADNDNTVSLTINRCGNEASVTGHGANAAGLVGGVYDNGCNNATLTISDCYNSGYVFGLKESAAFVGYGGKSLQVSHSWNNGTVSGHDANASLIRYDANATSKNFDCIYQFNGLDADTVATTALETDFSYGIICNTLNTQYGSTIWSQIIDTENVPHFSTDGISYQRSMSGTWGTVVLPYAVTSNSDVQLYEVQLCDANQYTGDGTLELLPVTKVDANTPCFFRKLNAKATNVNFPMGSETFSMTEDDPQSIVKMTDAEGWSLVGSYDKLSDLVGVYYLASGQLWYATEAISVPAYRAYLYYNNPNSNLAKCLSIVVNDGDEPTQIGEITADGKMNFFDQPVYNVAGQRVDGNTHGIVIKNGHKYMMVK